MLNKITSQDIVIVGAGPAGASTALFLAKHGIPHTLVEKAVFPRDKVCGDALSGKVVDVFKKLDNQILTSLDQENSNFLGSWGVQFVAPNGKALNVPFRLTRSKTDQPPGYIGKRIDFDYFLTKQLNLDFTNFLQNTQLKQISRKGDRFELLLQQNEQELALNPKIVIGAEGERSIVAKQLMGFQKELDHYCAGIRAYYEGVTDLHPENFIELHFLPEMLPGYFWIFPLPNGGANVGAGMLSSTVSKKRVDLKKLMLHAIATNPVMQKRFANAKLQGKIQGWGLPLGSKKRPLSGDGFMLVGDAASLIDPFTGEGIGNAMKSGMLAANTINNILLNNKLFLGKNLLQYDDAVYRQMWDELKLSRIMQKLIVYPWLFNLVVNKALKNATLRESITCMFEDLDMRARLKSPKFYFKLLFNN